MFSANNLHPQRFLHSALASTLPLILAASVSAAQSTSDTSLTPGQRVIQLTGMGGVHIAGTRGAPQTRVGINLVMPVRRVIGRMLWIVSTSEDDSGWVDAGLVLPLSNAVAHFDSLISRDSTDWDAYLRRAEAEHSLNLRNQATDDYSRAIALHPREAFLYLRRGRHYSTLKDCANELTDFQHAVALAPKSARQNYNLVAELHSLEAGVYFSCPDTSFRNYLRAVALARKAIAEDGSRATLVTILAAAYAQSGDFENAVKIQRRALARKDFPPGYREAAVGTLAGYVLAAARKNPR